MKADNKITVRKEEDKSQYYARYPAWSMTGTVNGDKEKMGKEYVTKQKALTEKDITDTREVR